MRGQAVSADPGTAGVARRDRQVDEREFHQRTRQRVAALGAVRFVAGGERRPLFGAVERADDESDSRDRHALRSQYGVRRGGRCGVAARQRSVVDARRLRAYERLDPSTCVERAVTTYLVNLVAPARGTVCPSDHLPFDPGFQ